MNLLVMILVGILAFGTIITALLSVTAKRIHRALLSFLIANIFMCGLFFIYEMYLLALIVLLTNIAVVITFLFTAMAIAEEVKRE